MVDAKSSSAIIGSSDELRAQGVVEIAVPDLAAALAFYCLLGFGIERQTPTFAALRWADMYLFLAQDADAAITPRSVNLRLVVPDVDVIWELVQKLRIPILSPIGSRPYGLRDFTIIDPVGFELRFAQVTA